MVVVEPEGPGKISWYWNGSGDMPTFSPSVLVTGIKQMTDEAHQEYLRTGTLPERQTFRCHSFVTDGNIQYLADCTHELAGQTVPLPDWET